MNKYGESLKFYLADIEEITSEVARSTFDESAIERLAEMMIATGCLLKPLVLKQVAPMKYQVLEGHFEYYAAVSANRKDTQRILSGMVSAFVVKPEVEVVAIQQAQWLNKSDSTMTTCVEQSQITEAKMTSTSFNPLENRVNCLESRLERELQELKTIQVQHSQYLENAKQLQLQMLETLNILKSKALEIVQRSGEEVESEILNALNTWDTAELVKRLKSAGITQKIAENLAENLVNKRTLSPFKSLKEITQSKIGIGKNTMDKIIAVWMK
jgi:hypothetical protein